MSADVTSEHGPAEHVRYFAYLHALEQVTDDDEPALVIEILTDPDSVMAQSAIVRYLARRVPEMLERPDYASWAETMARSFGSRPFLVQRLQEWSLFRTVALAQPWGPDALTGSSDWLQRKIVESLDSPEALSVLAEKGRTKRVRNTAKTRLTRRR